MYKIITAALIACILIVCLFLSNCFNIRLLQQLISNNTCTNQLPKDIKGKLLLRGYLVSGSHNLYWMLNLNNHQCYKLFNTAYTNKLDLKYLRNLKYNIDEQKVLRKYMLKNQKLLNFDLGLLHFDNLNIMSLMAFNPYLNYQEDNLISNNSKYRVILDRNNNKISILNKSTKYNNVIKMDNYFFGITFNPDNTYLALFEKVPFAFNDGSNYLIKFINLNTGKTYYFKDAYVSLPGSIEWLE